MNRVSARTLRGSLTWLVPGAHIDFWFQFCHWSAVYEAFFLCSISFHLLYIFSTPFEYVFFFFFIFPSIALCHSIYCWILLFALVQSCHLHYKIRRKTICTEEMKCRGLFFIFFHLLSSGFPIQFSFVFIYFYLVNLQYNGLFCVITFSSTIFFHQHIYKYD